MKQLGKDWMGRVPGQSPEATSAIQTSCTAGHERSTGAGLKNGRCLCPTSQHAGVRERLRIRVSSGDTLPSIGCDFSVPQFPLLEN